VVITEKCGCGKPFDYVLQNPPEEVGEYKIERSLSRGFYGAAYVVSKGKRGLKRALKLVPKSFYEGREEKILQEIDNHFAAAENAEFVVNILEEPIEKNVVFGSKSIECYCIEMEFIDGFVLSQIYERKVKLTPEMAVQISSDLLNLLRELHQRGLNHNDLHAGNIIVAQLQPNAHRAGAIDKEVKAVAIDLGSADSQRREGQKYLSDVQWVSKHMLALATILATDNPSKSDLRARLAFSMRHLALELSAPQIHQSDQQYQDLVDRIRESYSNARKKYHRAWTSPLQLSSLSQHRNAQTLESWHVPKLMVDPGHKWLAELNSGGPVIVTGMRGCGKTMLLRSLELHARIVATKENYPHIAERKSALFGDQYIGIYASARHLGGIASDIRDEGNNSNHVAQFFTRLFMVYSSRICDALSHLEEEFPGAVDPEAAYQLAGAIFGHVGRDNPIKKAHTLDELQTQLLLDAEIWSTDESAPILTTQPWQAFVLLAKTMQSVIFAEQNPQIAFLLDDVSTRYLNHEEIELVVSTLLVQDPSCSFKITSETQTFFLSIKSPAQINLASGERDYLPFDLGSKVLEQLKNPKSGEKFLESILSRRMAALGGDMAKISPKQVLGDTPLVNIAKKICDISNYSAPSDGIYFGFSALRGVCIGDLGTIIALYQEIVDQAQPDDLPVSALNQHKVYQTFCSNQLFQLNSRDQKLKSNFSLKKIALDFAEASRDELLLSHENDRDRLRQITSMNVTLDDGNTEQTKKLLELVDAGIFALHPRKVSARTKNKNSDPILQFQLSFRKILGISKLIGLSDRDRFELSGSQLLEWLTSENGATNLRAHTRRFGNLEEVQAKSNDQVETSLASKTEHVPREPELPFPRPEPKSSVKPLPQLPEYPCIETLEVDQLTSVENLVISLGFEDRCFASAELLALQTRPSRIIAVEYDVAGELSATKELADRIGAVFQVVSIGDLMQGLLEKLSGKTIVDASGLTKPAIFRLAKDAFAVHGTVLAAVSEPHEYKPTETDLANAIGDGVQFWGDAGVEKLSDILSGDELPYSVVVVEELQSDPSRNRKLCAFSSAKHGRLLHLIEEISYDEIDVFVPDGDSYRNKVALKAASIATRSGELGSIINFTQGDPNSLMQNLLDKHFMAYHSQRSNFDLALTGGKLDTLICGAAAAVIPVNKVLYVRPHKFDAENFSAGIGETKVYRISRNSALSEI